MTIAVAIARKSIALHHVDVQANVVSAIGLMVDVQVHTSRRARAETFGIAHHGADAAVYGRAGIARAVATNIPVVLPWEIAGAGHVLAGG